MMESKCKILFLLFFIFNISCKGQLQEELIENGLVDTKNSRYYSTHFFGPIKSVQWYYDSVFGNTSAITIIEEDTLSEKTKQDIMRLHRDIPGGSVYREFDKQGRLIYGVIKYTGSWFDLQKKTFDPKRFYRYKFDDDDWNKKNKINFKNKSKYPAFDYYQLLKPNHSTEEFNFGYTLSNEDSVSRSSYIYIYKLDESQRIKEENKYYKHKLDKNEVNNSELVTTTHFLYDKRGRLIRQNISPGDFGKNMPFTAMDTESGFCEDLHFAYEYDDKDRLEKVIFYGCGDTLQSETYTYHPTKDYITKMKRYVGGVGGDFQVTKNMVFHYDEYGNIIQRDYIKNYPNQILTFGRRLKLPESTYYKYDYDKYNNWYKCYIYMEGTREGEPIAVITRELEYYEN